jgi:glycerol-3-phosphate dehydrogenase subunit C
MRPDKPPVFDPNDPRYWDARDLEQELERVFSICHGCRMCVGYCPAFPEMFDRVDGYVTRDKGEIEAFDDADYRAVNQLCYQCKICYFKCPYTPDDEHPFMVDFPRLMLRHTAQLARRNGVSFQDRVMGEPQIVGFLGGLGSRMSNLVQESRLLRRAQEAVTGISAEFNTPPFASRTLYKWWRQHEPQPRAGQAGEVALFSTCTVNYNMPEGGAAAIQVLEHNGYAVHFPKDQTCCGMPNLDGGDMESALDKARRNVSVLVEHVRRGRPIIVPGPTCSYVLKKEYPELLRTDDARLVAERTYDLFEFLFSLARSKTLDLEFATSLGRVGLHAPCHLRAQKVGFPAMRVLKNVPDTEVTVVQECSAVDGTWGMKAQNYNLGRKYAEKLVNELGAGDFDWVATDCPLSGLRLQKELGVPPLHPIELLNVAYGLPAVRSRGWRTEA